MSDNTISVYDLVTKLCKKLLTNHKESSVVDLQKLRSKAFETLLYHREYREDSDSFVWENQHNYYSEFLAWQYILQKSYGLRSLANKIGKCISTIQESNNTSNYEQESLRSLFHLLLKLKSLPEEYSFEDEQEELKSFPFFHVFYDNDFEINYNLMNRFNGLSNDSFSLSSNMHATMGQKDFHRPSLPIDSSTQLNEFIPNYSHQKSKLNHIFHKQNISDSFPVNQDEWGCTLTDSDLYDSDLTSSSIESVGFKSIKHPQLTIWENLPTTIIESRTWESCGSRTEKEMPFLAESHIRNVTIFDNSDLINQSYMEQRDNETVEFLRHQDFKKDVVCLVVGLESRSFFLNEDDVFTLNPNVVLEGLRYDTFKKYCVLMLQCATCYKALLDMSTVCAEERSPTRGYIYNEFCNSVSQYLYYYRLSVLNYGEKEGIFQFHEHMRTLSYHLFTIASICKVGTYKENNQESAPNSVELLNYLYNQSLRHASVDVKLVIYSVLFPCVQNYFMRFLRPWLLEGTVNDPYNEFFIHVTHKYIENRNRSYWTRGFTICDEMVPKFLQHYVKDIYACGKAMNMLKLCVPKAIICRNLERKNYNLINCCTTHEELTALKEYVNFYELDIISSGGSDFSIKEMLLMKEKEQLMFAKHVAQKRATTLEAIQTKRLEELKELTDSKNQDMVALHDEYDKMIAIKREQDIKEIAKQIQEDASILKVQESRHNMIKEEAENMIAYYDQLTKDADVLNENIITDMNTLKQLESNKIFPQQLNQIKTNASDEINANTSELDSDNFDNYKPHEINSNITESTISTNSPQDITKENNQKETVLTDAQRNRMKVMNATDMTTIPKIPRALSALSAEAKRNKLKVMSTELGISVSTKPVRNIADDHNYKGISRSNSIPSATDNDNYLNTFFENLHSEDNNIQNNNNPESPNASRINYDVLLLSSYMRGYGSPSYVETINEKILNLPPRNRLRKLRQMRTCNTEVAYLFANVPESPSVFSPYMKMPKFAVSQEELLRPVGLSFLETTEKNEITKDSKCINHTNTDLVQVNEVTFLDYYISDSITTPLYPHMALVKNELLRHFIVDLKYLERMETLRNYYFLLDGEYSHNLVEGLFRNLYNAKDPKEVLNVRSLFSIFNAALDPMHAAQGFSLRIDKLPQTLDLGNVNTCDCLSLNFQIKWPLNVLLPVDTVKKYDDIFKFLLKIHRMSWVLKNIFMDMKILNKQCGRRSVLLSISMQYHQLELWRHMMTHFIQTFQSYIVGEVLQSGWADFQTTLTTVTNLDELYTAHATYIKQIHFLCLLNQKSAPLRKVVTNIFHAILKYYEYFRSREWMFDNSEYEHPNYNKLQEIFKNFMSLVKYFFKVGQKVICVGYQPQFVHLINLLNVNNFYSDHFHV